MLMERLAELSSALYNDPSSGDAEVSVRQTVESVPPYVALTDRERNGWMELAYLDDGPVVFGTVHVGDEDLDGYMYDLDEYADPHAMFSAIIEDYQAVTERRA